MTLRNQLTPADQVAYSNLLSWAADQVPHTVCGKPGIEQLPQLQPADVALVCRSFALDVTEQLIDDDLDAETALIERQDFAALGKLRAERMERACRAAIAYDVMCELEQRELDEDHENDLARWHRFSGIRVTGPQA